MDELARELASLEGAVVPTWNEARAERLLAGVGQLRRRRRAQRVATAGSLSLLALCLIVYVRFNPTPSTARLNASAPGLQEPGMALLRRVMSGAASGNNMANAGHAAEPNTLERDGKPLQLADGSKVHALSTEAIIAAEHNEPGHIALRLDKGSARFDVIPNTARQFVVKAGGVEVAVLGTVFDVERDGGRVRVSVTRGKVRVRGVQANAEPRFLVAGESAWFDDSARQIGAVMTTDAVDLTDGALANNDERVTAGQSSKTHAARSNRHVARTTPNGPRAAWRSLSQSGDYEGAYKLLLQESSVDDDSGALLDAADAARLSGHPHAAVQYLRKVLDEHRQTPVAPLAAFTLGRVLLERLGQPSEAAEAFATARQLAPHGSLAQDALAREVEAWSKAGHPDEAYRRAREYVDAYPQGRRLRSVQLYGGIQ